MFVLIDRDFGHLLAVCPTLDAAREQVSLCSPNRNMLVVDLRTATVVLTVQAM